MPTAIQRRLPIGAEPCSESGTHFRVWAPRHTHVEVVINSRGGYPLEPESAGYHAGFVENVPADCLYQFRLGKNARLYPDPASRFQPEGPHGPSQVIDASKYHWSDADWRGVQIDGQVLYEMHIGTFTREGTWRAARAYLPELRDVGITVIEIMPVAAFPGQFGWGYDGVNLFAPTQLYGSPDDFRGFVNSAHSLGLGVILDVVYNHFGPDGNYLGEFCENYTTNRYKQEWGEPINFDGPESSAVREYFISNARYWIEEFHLDGLRIDATQEIYDNSPEHVLWEITRTAREAAAGRRIILVAENEPQRSQLARSPQNGGCGLDALWNDDFHHSARVALTKRSEAYYSDYRGSPQELISAVKWGFLFQGQRYDWQDQPRGTPAFDLKPAAFINYIQNHDQVANTWDGVRLNELTSPALLRAMTGLLLLAPGTPMLFQGQEFGASTPFRYFADHHQELALLVQRGRAEFMTQFPSIAQSAAALPSPHDQGTFESSKLDHSEREKNRDIVRLHRDLLRLRREDAVIRQQRADWMHGAVLSAHAFALRFLGGSAGERLLIVNLGRDLAFGSLPEPLVAPPLGAKWRVLWSSELPCYGGFGRDPIDENGMWFLTGESTTLLMSVPENL